MMLQVQFGLLIVLLSLASLFEAKTAEEWKEKFLQTKEKCIKDLQLVEEEVPHFKVMRNYTKLEDFEPKFRCLLKCVMENMVGQDVSDMELFLKKSLEHFEEIAKDWSAAKRDSYLEAIKSCKGIKGENDCDTMVLLHLCERDHFRKMDFSADNEEKDA